MEQAALSLKRAAWSLRALPPGVVVSGQHQATHVPEPLAGRIETAASSVILHLLFSLLPHPYKTFLPPVLVLYSGYQLALTESTL